VKLRYQAIRAWGYNVLISLTEYAQRHGKSEVAARKKAARGGFTTAKKIGRNWIIDSEEPYVKLKKGELQMKEEMYNAGIAAAKAAGLKKAEHAFFNQLIDVQHKDSDEFEALVLQRLAGNSEVPLEICKGSKDVDMARTAFTMGLTNGAEA
jgi:hypothetical protein